MLRLIVHPIPRAATDLLESGVGAEVRPAITARAHPLLRRAVRVLVVVGALLLILAWIASVAMLLQLLTSWWQEIQYLGSPGYDLEWPT